MTTSSWKPGIQSGLSGYWRARLQVQPAPSYKTKMKYLLKTKRGYLTSDLQEVDRNSEIWTESVDHAQMYLDQENAFHKAGILASITGLDVQVTPLD